MINNRILAGQAASILVSIVQVPTGVHVRLTVHTEGRLSMGVDKIYTLIYNLYL